MRDSQRSRVYRAERALDTLEWSRRLETAPEIQDYVDRIVRRLWAHSANRLGQVQELAAHLQQVADLASRLSDAFGGGNWAYLAGLWHDLGKAHPAWQAYVRGEAPAPPDHALAGAWWAAQYISFWTRRCAGQ
jgi:hypothetical protein